MEVTLVYQDRTTTLTRPENKYGSNLNEFNVLVTLAFESIGLHFDGTITEAEDETK